MKDKIMCAAIWYVDLPSQFHLPKNIEKGLVICGYSHANCIDILSSAAGIRTSGRKYVQGFLTFKNMFVDRKEGMRIALDCGQISEDQLHNPRIGLFSEDLYSIFYERE